MTETNKPPRFPQLVLDELRPEQRVVADQIMKVSSVGIGGPYNSMLRSPVFAQRMIDLLDYLRWNSSLDMRLSEFAILIQGKLWRSQVEWYAHFPIALKAGLPESVALDLKAGRRPADMKPDEAVVYDFCMELCHDHKVSDARFAEAKQILGEQQVVDLVAVTGTYVTLAMLLSVSEATVPEGKEEPFKPGD
jgi:4-carboxymuconolactone decarboxylase